MALPFAQSGDNFFIPEHINTWVAKSGYTPARGHLVLMDSLNNKIDRCAADENPEGIIVSINSSAGAVSVAQFKSGTRITLEYTGTAPTVGQKIEASASPAFGTLTFTEASGEPRDTVQVDNTNGVGRVISVDSTATIKTCVVEF
jgi:hypothetical protein